jgi:hypothetical protein
MATVALKTVLEDICKKAGVDLSLEAHKDLATTIGALTGNVPQESVNAINTGLVNIEDAAKTPSVVSRVLAAKLGGLDNDIDKIAEESGVEGLNDKIKAVGNDTRKRTKLLIDELKAHYEAQSAKAKGTEKAELDKKIAELNNQNKALREQMQADLAKKDAEIANVNKDFALKGALSKYKFVKPNEQYPDDLLQKQMLQLAVDKLESEGFQVAWKDGKIAVLDKDGAEAFDKNNTRIDLNTYMDKVYAESNVLVKTDPAPKGPDKKSIELPKADDQPIDKGGIEHNANEAVRLANIGQG